MKWYRDQRVKDFESRAAHAPESVCCHWLKNWPYIPLHHFADESAWPVQTVECWCLLGSDAALLECIASEVSPLSEGFYIRMDQEPPCWPKLVAILSQRLTRNAVERAMQEFVEFGFPDPLLTSLTAGNPLLKLGS